MKPANQCGGYQGLQTASVSKQTSSKTICSKYIARNGQSIFFILTLNLLLRMISNFSAKQMPFKVNFTSDGFESQQEAMTPPSPNQNDKGFKLSYYQVGC